jgi:hypothetical protein
MKVVKYFTYCERALSLVIELLQTPQTQPQLRGISEVQLKKAIKATTCDELWRAVGRDFWVVTPCHGNNSESEGGPTRVMEGTRLMLMRQGTAADAIGYQFTIHTPGKWSPSAIIEPDPYIH